ncbi:hypothetical protein [Thioalkalivibrio thiocyanodenitrificans]|uniref:hypothetical protein n=1 Tax=Thioalkalivibrio thiocyanodenitrificans TaxID=243063 RepID=UPI000378DCED|nr:hypothetical protein [Thioalkalivibrio thiocyanodenitrificans]
MACFSCNKARKAYRNGHIACEFWSNFRDGEALPENGPFTGDFEKDLEMYGPLEYAIGWGALNITPEGRKGEGVMRQDLVLVPEHEECCELAEIRAQIPAQILIAV